MAKRERERGCVSTPCKSELEFQRAYPAVAPCAAKEAFPKKFAQSEQFMLGLVVEMRIPFFNAASSRGVAPHRFEMVSTFGGNNDARIPKVVLMTFATDFDDNVCMPYVSNNPCMRNGREFPAALFISVSMIKVQEKRFFLKRCIEMSGAYWPTCELVRSNEKTYVF